jgi:putative tricarboxylic transport membrane protein
MSVDCVIGTWRGVVGSPELEDGSLQAWDDVIEAAVGTASWADAIAAHRWSDTYRDRRSVLEFLDRERSLLETGLFALGLVQ